VWQPQECALRGAGEREREAGDAEARRGLDAASVERDFFAREGGAAALPVEENRRLVSDEQAEKWIARPVNPTVMTRAEEPKAVRCRLVHQSNRIAAEAFRNRG